MSDIDNLNELPPLERAIHHLKEAQTIAEEDEVAAVDKVDDALDATEAFIQKAALVKYVKENE